MISKEPITLTNLEQRLVKAYAIDKLEYNKKAGVENTFYGDCNPEQTHIESYGGEVALARLLNVYPNTDCKNYAPYDVVYRGKTIDCKTSKYGDNSWLAVKKTPHLDKRPPDGFALVSGRFPTYRFLGFISASCILDDLHLMVENNGKPLPHPCYVAKQDELVDDLGEKVV